MFNSPEEVPRIGIEELKKLMEEGAHILIVDNQPREVYDKERIQGAISIPWAMEGIPWEDAQNLPRDKETLIVTYCDCGPGEGDSADMALRFTKLGYTNVKALADPAIRGWVEAGYPLG